MASRLDRIAQQRRQKLDRIRACGINPYPPKYHRSHTTQQAIALLKQQEDSGKTEATVVSVAGRIMANRPMGKISFLDIRDGSGKIQLCFHKDHLSEKNLGLFK
ncbi:unnamed protein product, partial [marine sediment metagenome]